MKDLQSIFYPSLRCSGGEWHPLEVILEACGPIELHEEQPPAQPFNDLQSSMIVSDSDTTVLTPSATSSAERAIVPPSSSHHPRDDFVTTTLDSGNTIHQSAPEQRPQLRLEIPTCQTTVPVSVPITAYQHVWVNHSSRAGNPAVSSYGTRYEAVRAAAIIAATGRRKSLLRPDDRDGGSVIDYEASSDGSSDNSTVGGLGAAKWNRESMQYC